MSGYFLRLCWKNLWRNRRRTLITVNAIGVGVMALVWLNNYYDAFHEQLVENAIRYQSGHLLFARPGFVKDPAPNRYLSGTRELEAWLARRKEVRAVSPQVVLQGMLSSPQGSANLWFKGVDPEAEASTTRFAASLVSGRFLPRGREKGVVLGKDLAAQLKVAVGSKVVALTQGVDGSIGNELLRVTGIFETQSSFDKSLAFLRIEDARGLLSLPPGAVHQLTVLLRREADIAKVRAASKRVFDSPQWEALSWEEVQKNLMAIIELNRGANRILMFVILAISALGIANAILMSLLERKREFGVMMAVGTAKLELMAMVATETFLMGLVGCAVGNFLGISLTLYFQKVGFDLSWLTDEKLSVNGAFIQMVSYPQVHWGNSVSVSAAVLVLSFCVAIIPVRQISRLQPVKALRSL
jgi:ABC-type lipoprotein release transport system permease subunit